MDLTEARDALASLGRGVPEVPGRVTLDLEGPIARLVLDNPGARGAVTLGMMVDLADGVLALQEWSGSALIVSSTDPAAFCAGGHLGQVRRAISSPERAATMARAMGAVLDGLLDLPIVSVAVIRGVAVGGGAELATACDLRVLGPQARIHFVHARLGIAPGWGGTGRLVRLLGRAAALRVLAGAEPLVGDDAVALGLADRVDSDPEGWATATAERIASLPAEAIRAVKRQVVGAEHGDPGAHVLAFAGVWGGPAHLAALEGLRKHGG